MSEWIKAAKETKPEFREIDKAISDYNYSEPKKAEVTDERVRRLIAEHINKSRDFLFPMIEAAYLEKEMDNASALEDVMQWLDLFLLELGLPLVWDDRADYRKLAKLIKADVTMIRNSKQLEGILESMQDRVLHGRSGPVVKKCAQLKKYISDMLGLYKTRRHVLGG
jgi:hypothetical protein